MKQFVLADGRKVFIAPEAVTAIYDHVGGTAVVAIGQTNLVVPYTADEVLEILFRCPS